MADNNAASNTSSEPVSEASEARVIRHVDDGADRSVSSREHIRSQLSSDIEEFLAQGGTIQTVDPNITADPPRKPSSSYGSRPI